MKQLSCCDRCLFSDKKLFKQGPRVRASGQNIGAGTSSKAKSQPAWRPTAARHCRRWACKEATVSGGGAFWPWPMITDACDRIVLNLKLPV